MVPVERMGLALVCVFMALTSCALLVFWKHGAAFDLLQDGLKNPVYADQLWDLPEEPWEDRWAQSSRRQLDLRDLHDGELSDDWYLPTSRTELMPYASPWLAPEEDMPEFQLRTGTWQDETRFYGGAGCIENPFPDLPPGRLCSSPAVGVYLVDPYGNPYERRVQRRLRRALDTDAQAVARVVRGASAADARRQRSYWRGRWVNPASWIATTLLPNATACQDAVVAFYEAISNPGNLTAAADLLADDFVYQAPSAAGLLPACVPDLGGRRRLQGKELYTAAMEQQAEAFNGSVSSLEGNVTCRPAPTGDVLAPTMLCVARHTCVYTLKTVLSTTGANQVLEGEIVDRFWFDTKGLISRYQTDAEPSHFRYANLTMAEEGADDAAGDAA